MGVMRKLNRLAVSVAMLVVFGGMASQGREKRPVCDAPPPVATAQGDAESLKQALAEREAELLRLRAELSAREDRALYEEAVALGVVDAVKASRLPERQQRRLAIAIVREARLNGIDPLLVVAVIRTESSFNNYAVSHVGAMGLMQVMPDTGTWLAERRGFNLGRTSNLFDSELNVELGTAYLAELIERFGAVDKALVAYNAGPGNARKILKKPEVRRKFMAGYPKKVLGEFQKLQRAASRLADQAQQPLPDGRG